MADNSTDWESMWARGIPRGAAFDGNGPSPALVAHLARREAAGGKVNGLRALVPGAGRAWDALALAASGYTVEAWDIAPTAVSSANELVNEAPDLRSRVNVTCRDFFDAKSDAAMFDLVWDCTFLCALPKSAREAWAQRSSALLKRGGTLISCVFPILPPSHPKVLSGSGPPFAVNVALVRGLLEPHGFVLDETQSVFDLPESEQHLPGKMPDVKSGLLVFIKPTE